MIKLRDLAEKINIQAPPLFDEPLSPRTTFRIGGPADLLLEPRTPEETARIRRICREERVPVTLLGGGANVLIADRGIRGVTVVTTGLDTWEFTEESRTLTAGAGCSVDAIVKEAANRGWGGLEFLAGLPGTLGGALWMNARCYGREMADIAVQADVIMPDGSRQPVPLSLKDFSYKKSPFQGTREWIAGLTLSAQPGQDPAELRRRGEELRRDRREKGHFRAPSAGSTFKNNRAFGSPSGQIIDRAGLRGRRRGDAEIAPWHGNIFINRGRATAADMAALIAEVQEIIRQGEGFSLEPEVQFLGQGVRDDWTKEKE